MRTGQLDLDKLLVLEDEADMDVAVIMPNTQPEPNNQELGEAIKDSPRALGCAPHPPQRSRSCRTSPKSRDPNGG